MTAPITLMAAGEVRAALEAAARGDAPAAVHALLSIDPTSWQAIEHRLAALGTTLPNLITTLNRTETP
ncbi:hypothetical protein [Streptomyces lincolnensis]|uniref:hypothetical protein n=1 Tax=Streptomyces lincolnensis TaxID=1915 RepID=UPI00082A7099|nr:hypothetical protein [Streptomyces lincolnensis]QMV09615.1 hypothetical protein GJU35_30825 [Streptomyces lincolnensis]